MAIIARISRYHPPVLVVRLLACRLFSTAPGSQFGVTNENPQPARRAELGAFLRAQRARLRPADAGLPDDPHPGLRRTRACAARRSREPAARAVLSQFRAAAGQQPGDARFAALAAELSEVSLLFREWWAEYPG